MLNFFRRYQRFFFIVTTVVIVISFSFFGTYDSMMSSPTQTDEVVMTAIDGTRVYRSDLNQMAFFLQTDSHDKASNRGVWGYNFLNDGVIREDFLKTGLAEQLISRHGDLLAGDFGSNLAREKRYVPYRHPQVRFIGAESVWTTFSPALMKQYDLLRASSDPLDANAVQARIRLFLAEKEFPGEALRQILAFQQQQYDWVQPDPNLDRINLNLFGYRSLEDWFGRHFLHLISQVIIDGSALAEQRGYSVSDEEALADLVRLARQSFEQNRQSPFLGVTNTSEYYFEQLRRMGMTEADVVRIWKRVLLFRRLFQDVDQSVFVDQFAYRRFNDFAQEGAEIELYELPPELQLAGFEDLQRFEVYLDLTAKRSGWDRQSPLSLPTEPYSIDELATRAPELVQREYILRIASVDRQELQSRVGIRDMWKWQTENWTSLKQEFPSLGAVLSETDPLEVLEQVDASTRRRVNEKARTAIVAAHPEWVEEALAEASPRQETVGVRLKGGALPFEGDIDRATLISLLEAAPLTSETEEPSTELGNFTADNQTFYRVTVVEKPTEPRILSFAEARRDGTIEGLTVAKLEEHYQKLRSGNVTRFRDDKGEWKPLREVRDEVASSYFAGILRYIEDAYDDLGTVVGEAEPITPDRLAPYRLIHKMQANQAQLKSDPEANVTESTGDNWYQDQWNLNKRFVTVRRDEPNGFAIAPVLAMESGSWSNVSAGQTGSLQFYRVTQKTGAKEESLRDQMDAGQNIIGNEAQRGLMNELLDEIADAEGLTVKYLVRTKEEES